MTMMDNELIDIFDDCLNRLAAGETVEQCLRRYAAYDADLRPLLQTVRLAQRALPTPAETAPAQERGRTRLLAELAAPAPRPRVIAPRWWLAVAALLLVCFGIGAVTLNSLPGDPLYGLKRSAEDALIGLSSDQTAAIEAARQRRIDEIFLLVALGRPASVTFEGDVEALAPEAWRVAGLTLVLNADTQPDSRIAMRDRVRVEADVTADRQIIAREIRLLQTAEVEITPEPSPLAPTTTETATATPPPSSTPVATQTSVSPTLTTPPLPTRPTSTAIPAVTPTSAPFIAPTWTPVATRTPSPTPAETLLPSQRADCTTLRPSGWVTYQVRAGDSLSGLASSTGTSISMISQVNCLPESGLILVGQMIYLPSIPPTSPSRAATSAPNAGNPPPASSGSSDDSSGTRSGGNADNDDDASNNGDDDDNPSSQDTGDEAS